MRDDHVDRQVQHVEHRAGGGFGIFADGEALAVATTGHAVRELEMFIEEDHACVGDVIGEKAVAVRRIERQFLTGVERAQESDEFARIRRQNTRHEIGQPGGEYSDRFLEAADPFLGLFPKTLRRAAIHEPQKALGWRAVDDGQSQGLVAQTAPGELLAPGPIHRRRKIIALDRHQVRRDLLRDLMDVVAELRSELRDDPREERGHLVEIAVVSGVAVDAAQADALK